VKPQFQIRKVSGLFSKLEPGDEIMADKGFTIQRLLIPCGVRRLPYLQRFAMRYKLQVEPTSQPLSGESFTHATLNKEDGACLGISMNGFWDGRCEKSYFDVKVFNPYAPTNCSSAPKAIYHRHENTKKRNYEALIREVEHGTFTHLVFSGTGGMADQAIVFYKCLASLLSEKRNEHYAVIMGWIRCCLSFSLLRSAIRCIRGSRSYAGRYEREKPLTAVNLVQAETGLAPLHD